jgi:hypothetical protein
VRGKVALDRVLSLRTETSVGPRSSSVALWARGLFPWYFPRVVTVSRHVAVCGEVPKGMGIHTNACDADEMALNDPS